MDFYICILDNLILEFSTRLDAAEYFYFYQICLQYISDPYTFPIQNVVTLPCKPKSNSLWGLFLDRTLREWIHKHQRYKREFNETEI